MKVRKIYFDMDSVLADFQKGVRELAGTEPSDQDAVDTKDGKKRDDAMWEAISKVDHFYDKLELMPGAKELFDAVRSRYGADCEILSAVPKPKRNIKNAAEDKKQWVRRMLGENITVNIVYDSEEKKGYCTGKDCVLVDDLTDNVKDWQSYGGIGILYENAEETLKELRNQEII